MPNSPLKKFRVLKREVWVQTVEIEAMSAETAVLAVRDGSGEVVEGALEYSHDLPSDTWTVEP